MIILSVIVLVLGGLTVGGYLAGIRISGSIHRKCTWCEGWTDGAHASDCPIRERKSS